MAAFAGPTTAFGPQAITDANFQNTVLAPLGATTERFVAEFRIGDRGKVAEREGGLHGPGGTGTAPVDAAGKGFQYNWASSLPFKLSRTGSTVTFEIPRLNYTASVQNTSKVNFLAIRLRSTANTAATLLVLKWNGLSGVGGQSAVVQSGLTGTNPRYWLLKDLGGDFSFEGQAQFALLSGSWPTNSNLAVQIKGYEVVPEPSTYAALLAAGLAGMAFLRRRR